MCSFKMTGQHENTVLSSVTICNKASYGNNVENSLNSLTDFLIMSFNRDKAFRRVNVFVPHMF